jgi:uncharacterized protein
MTNLHQKTNKKKSINDPVYGFITLPDEQLFEVMEHPWFQRLRRIKQLGLTDCVYPSATHTRFEHAVGCLHLMSQAIGVLRNKGVSISEEEARATYLAILLHDIGHGPFSHALERTIITGISHEEISLLLMQQLNRQFSGMLDLTIRIFTNTYSKKFLHQLISSQLDMDRLDYLARDSFFTGVAEGVVNTNRIINMLTVVGDELVVEEKGIYPLEKFILARRLMYWQVYLHKTVLSADFMLSSILRRSKNLGYQGVDLFASPPFRRFLDQPVQSKEMLGTSDCLHDFALLDDVDILGAIKVWINHPDPILSTLSKRLVNRKLFRTEISHKPFDHSRIELIKDAVVQQFGIKESDVDYFVTSEEISNNAYNPYHERISILTRNREVLDISEKSDQLNLSILSTPTQKHLLTYPKDLKFG